MIRSASLRFAALYALVFALSAVALVVFLWYSTAGLLDRQVEAAINADAQGLAERWSEGGVPALLLTIQERLGENVDDDAIYALTDGFGRTVAGNLGQWPEAVTQGRHLLRTAHRARRCAFARRCAALRPARQFPPPRGPRCARPGGITASADQHAVFLAAAGGRPRRRRRFVDP